MGIVHNPRRTGCSDSRSRNLHGGNEVKQNLKTLFFVLFLICGVYTVCTKAYHVRYRPLPAGGADIAP